MSDDLPQQVAGRLLLAERVEDGLRAESAGSDHDVIYVSPDGPTVWRMRSPHTGVAVGAVGSVGEGDGRGGEGEAFLGHELSDRQRADYRPEEALWAMVIPYQAPAERLSELDDWYESEHTGLLLRCPDWKRVRRFGSVREDDGVWNRLVVHELSSSEVLGTPEVRSSMATARRRRLASEDWFLAGGRGILKRR